MKITLKTSVNHSKVSENHSKKSENHSNRVNFTSWGSSLRDSSFVVSSCPSVRSPKSEIHSIGVIFTLFGVIFTHFGMIFTRFESDFHSVRVFLTLFTLLKSNHFILFTLREYGLSRNQMTPNYKWARNVSFYQSGRNIVVHVRHKHHFQN